MCENRDLGGRGLNVGPLLLLVAMSLNCSVKKYRDPFSQGGLHFDQEAKTLTFEATFNAAPATSGTWHLIVHHDGVNGGSDKAIFSTSVSPHQIYEGLKQLGATDGNNVTPDNVDDPTISTQGSKIDIWMARA